MFLCLWAAGALAADLEVWSREEFGGVGTLAGSDGWEAGFADDAWRSTLYRAYTESDLVTSDTPGTQYGSGWAADNWLIRGTDIEQGGIEAAFESEDNDTMGVVFAHDGVDSFYLAGFSEDQVPPPLASPVAGPTVFLVKVESGNATVVDSVDFAPAAGGGEHVIRLERDDDRVWVSLDGALLIQATDPSPLTTGRSGLYAYASGEDFPVFLWDEDSPAWFERVLAFATDEDGDEVADDFDNCETLANTDQLDSDADGLGDVCDESPGTTAPDPTDTGAPVTDTGSPVVPDPTGTDPTTEPRSDDGDSEGVSVGGCSTAPAAGATEAVLGLLGLLRRQARP